MRGSVAVLVLELAACSHDVRRPPPSTNSLDTYLLRVRVSGNGEVSVGRLGDRCADDCTYHVQRGKTVTLTAAGKEDVFHTWSDRCASDASCTIKMASNVSIRAEFGLDRYQLVWIVPLSQTDCLGGRWLDWGVRRLVRSMTLRGPVVVLVGDEMVPRRSTFVAALSLEGSQLWERVYGPETGTGDLSIDSVASSTDGIVIAGSAFLAELSTTGERVWIYAWPIAHGQIRAIAVDAGGDLFVTGSFLEAFELGGHRIEPANTNERCTSSFVARFTRTGDRSPGRGL